MRVSSAELIRDFGALSRRALTEPVTIIEDGRDRLVLVAAEEFERLRQAGRRALAIGEPSEAEVAEIATARMPAEYDHLEAHTSARKPGRLKGKVQVGREVLEPLPEEELARWEGR